jgi:hypothetical protein
VESGGAIAQLEAYCGFVDETGLPLAMRLPVMSIGVNGPHQAVLSPSLIRVQMFRAGNAVELLLTAHLLVSIEGKGRPQLQNAILFHAKYGRIDAELWGKGGQFQGSMIPIFSSRSADELRVPDRFHDAVLRATAGVCCCGCRHCHLSGSGTTFSSPDTSHPSSGDAR